MELRKILEDVFAMKDSEYQNETSIMSLKDFDSMNHMIFIGRLEEDYSIEVSGEEIMKMQTIGEIKKILETRGILNY